MTLRSKTLAGIVAAVLFGGIVISNSMGWWLTESSKEAATFTEGEFAGMPDPADIRGSYTFGDVEKNFGVPAGLLAEAFGVETDDPAAFQVKNLETQYEDSTVEIGTASVRLFVAFYTGLPYDLSAEESWLPEAAARSLLDLSLEPERVDYINSHTLNAVSEPVTQAADPTELPATETETADTTVKGKTTFAELLSWGLPQESIESILGLPLPEDKLGTVKDFATANGLDFETLKTGLQELVDALK
jgi:hypothetical protein